jgi:hypothetical protein
MDLVGYDKTKCETFRSSQYFLSAPAAEECSKIPTGYRLFDGNFNSNYIDEGDVFAYPPAQGRVCGDQEEVYDEAACEYLAPTTLSKGPYQPIHYDDGDDEPSYKYGNRKGDYLWWRMSTLS